MKKIKALQNYTDTKLKKEIVKGDEYIVDNERAEAITKVIYKGNPLAEVIEEEVKEVTQEETSTIEYEEPIRETQALPRAYITTTKKKAVKKK